MPGGTVAFPVAPDVAFDYLVDPANRAEWQSSLRRVDHVAGDVGVGQHWVDVTKPGLRPLMRTTVFERPARWAESGSWHGVTADLELRFTATPGGCDVAFGFRVRMLGPVGRAFTAASVPAVRSDLRRAAEVLSRRS
ncbi:SRPBCC family protein [Nocardioides sp.]|uniref:SRPBCC family protein n=1 Tax=Nocardioides sp. TaxID=35761 RepID=UPI003783A673